MVTFIDEFLRFSKVAYLRGLGSLYIRGNIASQMLSKRTTYIMYLVFKLDPNVYDDLAIGNSVVIFANRQTEVRRKRRRTGYPNVQRRFDGWMEIEMGKKSQGRSVSWSQHKKFELYGVVHLIYWEWLSIQTLDGFMALEIKAVVRFVGSESYHELEQQAKVVHFLG
ncbi:hypothetical protein H5410_062060 [Solanum commersonii]|uniref:Uncharacterized protein n=1 Tax=Solanum commersonii TaxID=4109 RepID=A0A9J5WBH3_SOLCO|nr:hypothetical protein H5410_062060 [Solanum commersonii]